MKWPRLVLPGPDTPKETSLGMLNWLSILLLFFGIVIVLLFGTSLTGKATIFLWMLACLMAGTAVGFLFGIPKILQSNQVPPQGAAIPAYQQQVNTNLTEISDWLTKIIVGLGLVNLTKIPPYIARVAQVLAAGLSPPGSPPSAVSLAFGYGTIITYTILGFLFGYITTRLYLAGAFSRADQEALQLIARRTEDAVGAAQSALQKVEFALAEPSPSLRSGGQSPEEELAQLAQTYNHIRSTMPSGSARTHRMTEVVKGMMALVPALTTFDVSQALKSNDNGIRLTGYAYLYVKPDVQRLEELVDAFTADPTPFGQYWGIQALGKILQLQPGERMHSNIYRKLNAYYNQLEKGIDREYELRKLLPELRK